MFQIDLNKKHCLPFDDFRCPFFVGQYCIPPRNFRKSGFHQDKRYPSTCTCIEIIENQ